MKKVLFLGVFVLLTACQNTSTSMQQSLVKGPVSNAEVAACTNGFDDVNVCQLKS